DNALRPRSVLGALNQKQESNPKTRSMRTKSLGSTSTVTLSLHGAVGAGKLTSVNMGRGSKGTFVCGPIMEQLNTAHSLSGTNECVLSKEAHDKLYYVGNLVSVKKRGEDGCMLLDKTRLKPTAMDEFYQALDRTGALGSVSSLLKQYSPRLGSPGGFDVPGSPTALAGRMDAANEALRSYVPEMLIQRITSGQSDWLGQ
ncbi:unnamed protein product, partial [Chrysoparadoxa australica]